ncbi:Gfo/Idh/MocA family protein [Phaeobacter marinintestinus]|uniref:Gfo/Idh/MocA family protein n=1 Tax=Falsiphaeobacter marinintestinus TaxID=1492905 RepID=UPI0011B669CB|nr:Gfo/Idh/MocA family oxidoreductase [Phaeobacter marinintestinus]
MTTFTVAVAGFGWWGQHFARRLEGHPFIKIAGIVEPFEGNHDAIRAMGLAVYDTLAEVTALDEVDAVILATPNPLHEEQVIHCAQAGKHVFCEKPLGLTAASARRSVQACRDAGVQLGIGHERRFEPGMLALKAAIDAGELGTLMHAEAAFSHDKLIGVPKGDWRTSKAVSPAAGMTAMGIHLTDLMISFFGPVETVQAMTASRSLGWETGDVVTVQLGFEAGMTATLSAVLHTPHFIRMHVFGTDKWIEVLNDTHPDTPGGKVRYVTSVTGQPLQHDVYDWADAVSANLEAFAAAAMGESEYPFTLDQMVHNIEVLEAITISAEDRRTVFIRDLRT